MMRLTDIIRLTEDPENDLAMREQAVQAYNKAATFIIDPANDESFILLDAGKKGEFYACDADACDLGIPNTMLMIGLKPPRTIGWSGGFWRFSSPQLGKFTNAIVIQGLTEMTRPKMRAAAYSTEFRKTFCHEFMHALDNIRSNTAMMGKLAQSEDQPEYYNSPVEFNAYYHDLVGTLTELINDIRKEPNEDPREIAAIYNITGNFKQDLRTLVLKHADSHTKTFLTFLYEPRFKRLLRRIYKLHQILVGLLK